MAYILNEPYDPSTFPGQTIRRPPYYDLGPSTQIPNAPYFPAPYQTKWHADVSGLGDWRFPWTWGWLKNAFKGGEIVYKGGYGPDAPEGWEKGVATREGQGWLAKLFGGIGGGLKNLFTKLQQGGSGTGTETQGGGTQGGGTGTNQPKTIAGIDQNILLVIGCLAIGGIFLIMSRPTASGQPQIIMPEMFRPRRTYARKRTAPRKHSAARSRTTSRRRR